MPIPRFSLLCLVFALVVFPPSLRAAIDGPPITNNDYQIDLARTVVTGSPRKIGLGGAYTAVPSGVSSIADNPASVAVHRSWAEDRSDWDFGLVANVFTGDDTDNSGSKTDDYQRHAFVNAGLMGQSNGYGLGVQISEQQFDLNRPVNPDVVRFTGVDIVGGHVFFDGQLALGVGLRALQTRITPQGQDSPELLSLRGLGGTAGLLWRPGMGPWRIGGVYKGPITREQGLAPGGPVVVNGLIVPDNVVYPLEGSFGVAYENKNPPVWPGHPVLVAADVRMIGSVDNAFGIQSMAEQKQQVSGRKTTPVAHLGVELEPWSGHLRLRGGTYYEPSRFDHVGSRQHITGGFQCRLFRFPYFGGHWVSFSYGIDYAARYLNNGVSIEFWR